MVLCEDDPSCLFLQELKIQKNYKFIDPSSLYRINIKLPNNMQKWGHQVVGAENLKSFKSAFDWHQPRGPPEAGAKTPVIPSSLDSLNRL